MPNPYESDRDRRIFNFIRILVSKFEVHFLYVQNIDEDKKIKNEILKLGAKIYTLRDLKIIESIDWQERFVSLLKMMKFKIIFFNTYITARYYLPYIIESNTKSIIIIDTGKSEYLYGLTALSKIVDTYKKSVMQKNVEIYKMKEIPVYNYADVVIAKDEYIKECLSSDIPNISIKVIPEFTQDMLNSKNAAANINNIFLSAKRKTINKTENAKIDIVIVKKNGTVNNENIKDIKQNIKSKYNKIDFHIVNEDVPLIKRYNLGLKKISNEYGLILTDDTVTTRGFLKNLLICAQSHPNHGIVMPASNINFSFDADKLNEAARKHYYSNFGFWLEATKMLGFCMFVKKSLIEMAGLLDERFMNLVYSLSDFTLKAFQLNYKTILVNDTIVYYKDAKREQDESLRTDYKLLFEKWCNLSVDFLERLN